MRTRLLLTTLATLVWTAGCGDSPGTTSDGGVTRDSAGVTIVQNTAPAWTADQAWTLSAEPILQMGVPEGDPDHEFFQVMGETRLSDGTIVVANSGTQQLRYYSPDGSLRATAGRKGGGPGEFQMLMTLVGLPGDSVLTFDAGNRRLSLFDAAGHHVRDFGTTDAGSPVPLLILGRLDDGTYVAQLPNMRIGPEMFERRAGPARDSVYVMHLDAAAAPMDTLGLFPGPVVQVTMIDFAGRSLPMPLTVPFSPGTDVAVGADRIYLGISDTWEIDVYSPAGALQRIIRRTHEPRAVTDSDIEKNRSRLLEAMDNQSNPFAKQLRDAYATVAYPATMPAFGEMRTDPDGNLWVAEFSPSLDESRRWSVFDPDGRWLGDVTTPPQLVVREIGSDYVLGQTSDEMETEHVLLYRLIKPAP